MIEHSERVIEHFRNPKNAGMIEDTNGVGEIGDPSCGDFMKVYIKVENDIVADVKYSDQGLSRLHSLRKRHDRACDRQAARRCDGHHRRRYSSRPRRASRV